MQSTWGGADLVERPSLFNAFGEGWHVDRQRFDQLLFARAARAGALIEQGVGSSEIARDGRGWTVRTESGLALGARYLVDASGRGAPATAIGGPERRWLGADRLVALVGLLAAPGPLEPVLLLEPAEEGWWYSVPQPAGALLVTLMTDGDLLPAGGRAALARHFHDALARSSHTSARAAGAKLRAEPWIARSESGLLLPDGGPGWRAIGDAALAFDPLSGDGVARALRSGLDAAPEIDAELRGALFGGPSEALRARFREYIDGRGTYYGRERRWPDARFWRRRQHLEWKTAPLFLDPRQPLRWDGTPPPPEAADRIEALLPPRVVRAVLERLRSARPAHEALALLRAESPLEDQRLLVGLHYLVHCGCVATPG